MDGRLFPGKSFPLNAGKLFGVGQPVFPPSGVKFSVQEKWISFLGDSGDFIFGLCFGCCARFVIGGGAVDSFGSTGSGRLPETLSLDSGQGASPLTIP